MHGVLFMNVRQGILFKTLEFIFKITIGLLPSYYDIIRLLVLVMCISTPQGMLELVD